MCVYGGGGVRDWGGLPKLEKRGGLQDFCKNENISKKERISEKMGCAWLFFFYVFKYSRLEA